MTVVVGASGVITRDGTILLVRRGSDPYKGRWSLPGGKLESDEPIRETVRREIREETGLEVEVGHVAGLREEISPDAHYIVIVFHCTATGGELRAGDDAAECEWVDASDIAGRQTTPGLGDVVRDSGLVP